MLTRFLRALVSNSGLATSLSRRMQSHPLNKTLRITVFEVSALKAGLLSSNTRPGRSAENCSFRSRKARCEKGSVAP